MSVHFIAHDPKDSVGVVVVDQITPNQTVTGWIMDTDETVELTCKAEIPLGHKIALRALKDGDTVLKYGHDIGKAVADVPQGDYLHVHNCKTKRW